MLSVEALSVGLCLWAVSLSPNPTSPEAFYSPSLAPCCDSLPGKLCFLSGSFYG